MRAPPRFTPWYWSVLVGLVALAAYLWLAPPVSGDRDSSEFTLVLAFDGIAHPTGYPLYTLLGHWFVRALVGLGSPWAFAANAWSALGGAVAVALMHALAARLVPAEAPLSAPARALLPIVPVALFLLNPAWIGVTTVAEVYSWHQAWVMGAGLCFWKLTGAGDGADAATPRGGRESLALAAGWVFLCGVGVAHHLTSLLVSGPLTIALLVAFLRSGRWRVRHLVVAAAASLIPLSSYLLLWGKMLHPGPAQWPFLEPTWAGFWRHVTGAQYRGALGGFAPAGIERQLLAGGVYPFLFPGLLTLAAAAYLARGSSARLTWAAFLAAALLQTVFSFGYGVGDPSSYFLPPVALGLLAVGPVLAAVAAAGRWARAAGAVGAGALGLVALALAVPWARAGLDLRATQIGLDGMLMSMWGSIPLERGLVLWRSDMYQRLREYQLLRGEKPGLDVVNPWMLTDPVVRRRFEARYGFDPVGGLTLARRDLLASGPENEAVREFFSRVTRRINENTDLPVVVFAPEMPIVRLLSKPAARATTAGRLDGPAPARAAPPP